MTLDGEDLRYEHMTQWEIQPFVTPTVSRDREIPKIIARQRDIDWS